MAPVHGVARAGHFRMTVPRALLLSVLIYSTVSDIRCPDNVPSPGDCSYVFRSVAKGGSVSISLKTSETTLDLCKLNRSTAKWDAVSSFVKGNQTKLNSGFQEQVSVSNGTFVVENVSQGADGNYVFQDTSEKCLAQIALTVVCSSGSPSQSSAHQKGAAAAWYWCMFPILSLLRWP
ncbi:uncharacterized protein LOC135974911 isoform X3 [Chrysemys picta bellii]|uniref:uncharacterized protein LOC135974911 isoform X3 n=1 Tax=Chrysemys picta bellii TaxID=8478 RepID=UPI0032B18D33